MVFYFQTEKCLYLMCFWIKDWLRRWRVNTWEKNRHREMSHATAAAPDPLEKEEMKTSTLLINTQLSIKTANDKSSILTQGQHVLPEHGTAWHPALSDKQPPLFTCVQSQELNSRRGEWQETSLFQYKDHDTWRKPGIIWPVGESGHNGTAKQASIDTEGDRPCHGWYCR